ncbi:MAG: Acetolactate synthase small subunit, partial [uncultured Thermoleophilia bacterium]
EAHPERPGRELARRAVPRGGALLASGVQHREPRRRADGAGGPVARHDPRRLLAALARPGHEAAVQAHQRAQGQRDATRGHHRARADVHPRDGGTRGAVRPDAAGRGVRGPRRGRRPDVAALRVRRAPRSPGGARGAAPTLRHQGGLAHRSARHAPDDARAGAPSHAGRL